VLAQSVNNLPDKTLLSIAETVSFPTTGKRTAYGFYYPPMNPKFTAPANSKPPLIVISHGGPTGMTTNTLRMSLQYWTSRGFAILDVNYGGSTGYGRPYREALNGQWGVVDVDDCEQGALHLAAKGLVDPNRLIIRGGSAGGFTTLCALTFRKTFKAGASHYGVSDLAALAQHTHKFESRYDISLVGNRDRFPERSPIYFVDRISCPIIFFQGLDDKVVPPEQAERMVEALRAQHIPVAYITYEGEGHGFRKAENIQRTLEAELYFYSKVFGFELQERVTPVEIQNHA
jgi:dipeptidyl aminopeptidase/acylaminoacyl peptidase